MNSRRGRRSLGNKHFAITEPVSIAFKIQLDKFLEDDNETEMKFPTFLSAKERGFIHEAVAKLGLKSKSRGKGVNRYITVYKRTGSTIIQEDAKLVLDANMRSIITDLYNTYPLTNKEKEDLCLIPEKERSPQQLHKALGHLNNGLPQVPNTTYNPDLIKFREKLPVYEHKQELLNAIVHNQVIIVAGATGSGKTTQIPQLVLDYCQEHKQSARIYCTQPRRISAVSVAERVAYERMEKIGQSIGYQIRLESRISPRTVLTYCTNGVLLRTMMGGDAALAGVSHIFVDEVHERDKFCDFLLIALRDILPRHKELRLILMSATMDTQTFSRYFGNCPVISIPGRLHEVQRLYLEDILHMIQYFSPKMKSVEKEFAEKQDTPSTYQTYLERAEVACETEEDTPMDATLQADMDEFLDICYKEGSLDSFGQLLYMYMSEGVCVDCAHANTGITGLMCAARHGATDTAQQMIDMGADIDTKDTEGKTAYDYAVEFGNTECAELLSAPPVRVVPEPQQEEDPAIKYLLDLYLHSVSEDLVDHELIAAVVRYFNNNMPKGAILVFLPGYDDILTTRDILQQGADSGPNKYQVFMLHSNMQTHEQKRVFQTLQNTRKVILSTNIAETSVTIDDVVYVVDSCKVKEKYYECNNGVCSLRCVWASQAALAQRAGRAGRVQPGMHAALVSRARAGVLPAAAPPELVRAPLHDLCLLAKLLAPTAAPVADWLARAPDPPSFLATRAALTLLKTIGALSPLEDLTELGRYLLELTIDPRLGKMLLYACVLKCLDPVLTIVCALAEREPWSAAATPAARRAAADARKAFAGDTNSDHMALLRAFQSWQSARASGTERAFCQRTYICGATMESIACHRARLLAQLRALGLVRARPPLDIKDVNSNADDWSLVVAALVSGLYPALARVDRGAGVLRTVKDVRVQPHPASVMRVPATDWLVFEEVVRAGRLCWLRVCTSVSPLAVALMGGSLRLASRHNAAPLSDDSDSESDSGGAVLALDDWALLATDSAAARGVLFLRHKLAALLLRRLAGAQRAHHDDAVLAAVAALLRADHANAGLTSPAGVGARPRPMPPDGAWRRSVDPADGGNDLARYFVVRADDHHDSSNYSFAPNTAKKISKIRQEGNRVIVFLSNAACGKFVACAAVTDTGLEWLSTNHVSFHTVRHVTNTLAGGARVVGARDGHEICAASAKALLAAMSQPAGYAAPAQAYSAQPAYSSQQGYQQPHAYAHQRRRPPPRPIQKHNADQ